jgi:hypothetical protein
VSSAATGQFIAHRDALAGACRGQHEVHIREDDALAEIRPDEAGGVEPAPPIIIVAQVQQDCAEHVGRLA